MSSFGKLQRLQAVAVENDSELVGGPEALVAVRDDVAADLERAEVGVEVLVAPTASAARGEVSAHPDEGLGAALSVEVREDEVSGDVQQAGALEG